MPRHYSKSEPDFPSQARSYASAAASGAIWAAPIPAVVKPFLAHNSRYIIDKILKINKGGSPFRGGKRRRDYSGFPRRRYRYKRSFMPRYRRRRRFNGRRRRRPRRFSRRRRYNKSSRRFYKRVNWNKGNLRGMVGPQCMPSHAMCKFKRKIAGQLEINAGNTAKWSNSKIIISSDAASGTFGASSSSFMTSTDFFTTPFIEGFLKDAFDEVRIYAMALNLTMFVSEVNNSNDIGGFPLTFRINSFDFGAGSASDQPQTTDTITDAMLSKDCVLRHHRPYFYNGTGTNKAYAPQTNMKFKKFWSCPSIMTKPSTAKEYFMDPTFANLITGALGARSYAAPTSGHHVHVTTSWAFSAGAALAAAQDVQVVYMGTITQYTHWSKRNPNLKYAD